jgi:hypothetical protein
MGLIFGSKIGCNMPFFKINFTERHTLDAEWEINELGYRNPRPFCLQDVL